MKQISIKTLLLAGAVITGLLSACSKDPQDPSIPTPAPQQPNPLPENALIEKIKWSENDHYTITYNEEHMPVKVVNQWQFVEGDPTKIRTIEYLFDYDAQGLLRQVVESGGWTVKYFYQNKLIDKVMEYYPGGELANQTEYIYDGNRIVQENYIVFASTGEQESYFRRFLKYDAKGNLVKEETLERQDNMVFVLAHAKEYSQFDQHINPTQWLLRYPYLPQVRWQFNNPGKEVVSVRFFDPVVYHYVHEYNNEGLPISRTEIKPLGTLKADFEYHQ